MDHEASRLANAQNVKLAPALVFRMSYFSFEMNTSVVGMDGGVSFYLESEANTSDVLWPEYYTDDFEEEMPWSIGDLLVPVVYCLVCAVGLLGNSLVVFTIVRHVKMRTVANIYILNLALADGLFMLGLPFLAVQIALHRWPFGHFMCRLVMVLDGINQFTSVFCIMVMSVDRYVAVAHPIRSSQWRTPNLAKIVSAVLWLISFTPVIPMAIYSGVDDTAGVCTFIWPEPIFVWNTAFVVCAFVVGFALPFAIISLCYTLMLVKLKTTSVSRQSASSEKKMTGMVVAIVVVFAICWLPFYAINICVVSMPIPEHISLRKLFQFTVALSYFNSCVNPILYICLSESFGRAFQRVLCPKLVQGTKVARGSDTGGEQTGDLMGSQPTITGGVLESALR